MPTHRFRPHLYPVLAIAPAVVVALAWGGPVADAALPSKGARYTGKTSQGLPVGLKMGRGSRRTIDTVAMDIRTKCGKVGSERFYTLAVLVGVSRTGRFRDVAFETQALVLSFEPVVIDGTRRAILDVTKTVVTGRFVSRRKVTGTWRNESAIYDKRTYPSDERAVDKCDTGVVTWSARLKR